jgi:YVTN family beta-propeller protein
MTLPSLRALALVVALAAVACNSPTDSDDNGFEGRLDGQLLGTRGRPFGLGIAPTGAALALQVGDASAARFNASGGPIRGFVEFDIDGGDLAFTASGSRAYVVGLLSPTVYIVDMEDGLVIDETSFGEQNTRILMHPDDTRYYVLSHEGVVRLVPRATNAPSDSVALGADVLIGIARRAQDGRIAVAGGPSVFLLDGNTLDVVTDNGLARDARDLAYSADGTRLFAAMESAGIVLVLEPSTLAVTDSIVFPADSVKPFGMVLSPDGRTMLVSSPETGTVAVVDPLTLAVRRVVPTGGIPRRIAFSPNGRRAFIANEDGWIDVMR